MFQIEVNCITKKSHSTSQPAGWKASLHFGRVETEFNKANRVKDTYIKSVTIISHLSKFLNATLKKIVAFQYNI